MGVLHYALNHTRKEVYSLGKSIYFHEDRLPQTFEEMHNHVWAEINPEENFVDKEWGTPERAEKIAKELWAFCVEGYVSDVQDDLIEERYGDYKIVGSIHEGDDDIGKLMFMYVSHDRTTMIVQTERGYERRKIASIQVEQGDSRRGSPSYSRYIPVLHEREEIYSHVHSEIPFVRMRPFDPMAELDDLHLECCRIAEQYENRPDACMSYAEQIKVARYRELLNEYKNKMVQK